MKTRLSTVSSAEASLSKARKRCRDLLVCLARIDGPEDAARFMPRTRAVLAELEQRVHEFNAYTNVVMTE